ncbi:little elongation complex subunit 1 isoform X1 [Astyanax mexicanus]|uniref:little elongation complex subunit 1 isoform X1 n=1 Tax=Astyanax mexicanus TaxID=7994 RepID=UPI0020CAC092|nr:little elongation complex subunit 1 isoform X1 [Astyanax mexicanus]
MMPGEKQAEAGGEASEATSGTCENCTLLNRSLDEYMAALLTLKQKIIDTDHFLSEYKEKCDELQKSQRESSKLHLQLEEVLLKLGPLEKQAVDFEAVKAELEETKAALKSYQQKCEEVGSLREENAKTLTLNEKLKGSLQMAEDEAKTQRLEYAMLKSEKETLEKDLQKTQDNLRISQQAVEEVENLRLQNAKTLIVKSNLENQLLLLEDTKVKQNNEITDLKRENCRLEENLGRVQAKLEQLEKEVKKEKRSISTQTKLEPKIDKAKVKMLLEELWHSLEPLSQTSEMLDLNENQHLSTVSAARLERHPPQLLPISPCRKQMPQSATSTPAKRRSCDAPGAFGSTPKAFPDKSQSEASFLEENSRSEEQKNEKSKRAKRKRSLGSEEHHQSSTLIDTASDRSSDRDCWRSTTDVWEILDFFKSVPTALSPLPVSNELVELDEDISASAVKESSSAINNDGEKLTVKNTEPMPVEDAEVTPSVSASPGSISTSSLANTEMSSIPLGAGHEVTNSFLSDTQEMEVNELSEAKEVLEDVKPNEVSSAGSQNGHEMECGTTEPVPESAHSQLSNVEDHMNLINIQTQSVGSKIPDALFNDVMSKSSDTGNHLISHDHKCLIDDDADKSIEPLSVAEANGTDDGSEIHLNSEREAETEPERTVEEIQGGWTEGNEPKTPENQKSVDRTKHDSSSSKITELSSGDPPKPEELSDEEEFSDLKRKVRGISSKPKNSLENLNSVPPSLGQGKPTDQLEATHSETEEDIMKVGSHIEISKALPVPENEGDFASLEDKYNTDHTVGPKDSLVINGSQEMASVKKLEDESLNLLQTSLTQITHVSNNNNKNNELHKLSGASENSDKKVPNILPSENSDEKVPNILPSENSVEKVPNILPSENSVEKVPNTLSSENSDEKVPNILSSESSVKKGPSVLSSGLKEHSPKAMDICVDHRKDQKEVCLQPRIPAVQNPVTLPGIDKELNPSPLTILTSKDALTSSPSPDSIGRVRTEMGPPLPPVVMPLTATPPKFVKHHTPVRPNIKFSACLPSEGQFTSKQTKENTSLESSLQHEAKMSPCLNTPSPSNGVPSSPLQFGSATPKHAVPVPGRLPSSALNPSSPTASQENSMQMLDTMYPELSAQARTLNILRGNVNLSRVGNESGTSPPSVNHISGNKTISSSSTAFTKTEQKVKRTGVNVLLPKSAKKLRLDSCSPSPVNAASPVPLDNDPPASVTESTRLHPGNRLSGNSSDRHEQNRTESQPKTRTNESQITEAIEKLQHSCFDILPVIKSHVFLGRISQVPTLREEEKSVISDFCSNQWSADEFMSVILTKLKAQRSVWKQEFVQSVFRVYTGLCRQRGDVQKAHALAYSLLKENYSEASKMILFMLATWPGVLAYESSLCKAIHIVSKLKAEGEILDYLSSYLHWDKRPPDNIYKMIKGTLKALLVDVNLKFQKHDRHGEDLCPTTWEYIFTLDLLCAHLGWKWTHDNIIRKELWTVLDAWVTQPRLQQTPVRDVCVAAVMRLIGRLGQLGIKEKTCQSVQNVAKAINLFGKHAISQGVPWEVQLSAIYTIYDLAPCNPKEALEALASWRGETTQSVPSGVTSCITQIGCLCRQIKP